MDWEGRVDGRSPTIPCAMDQTAQAGRLETELSWEPPVS